MRIIERTMPTHFKSTVKRNKKKSVKSHVDKILISGFLSNEDSLLLQNTLELMKILSKIKRYFIRVLFLKMFVIILVEKKKKTEY